MAGIRSGPPPKREEERNRRNVPSGGNAEQVDLANVPFEIETVVEPPEPDDDWHQIAYDFYMALQRDPARIWMGPADWMLAYTMCENLSREMKPQVIGIVEGGIDIETGEKIAGHVAREVVPMKGTAINALLKWVALTGITEGARLGLRKEVTFNEAPKADLKDVSARVTPIRAGHFSQPVGG